MGLHWAAIVKGCKLELTKLTLKNETYLGGGTYYLTKKHMHDRAVSLTFVWKVLNFPRTFRRFVLSNEQSQLNFE